MRARTLSRRADGPSPIPRTLSPAGLVFLRGRDAHARLRQLHAVRVAARPLLGALAVALTAGRAHEALGYRSLGDYARERLGVEGRTLREWARVWRALTELPVLREAVLAGEISWGVARLVVAHVSPETQQACREAMRGRTVRAAAAIVAAYREAGEPSGRPSGAQPPGVSAPEDDRLPVRLACTAREAALWSAAVELARRMAGEPLPVWECAERIAAEAASALGREAPAGLVFALGPHPVERFRSGDLRCSKGLDDRRSESRSANGRVFGEAPGTAWPTGNGWLRRRLSWRPGRGRR